MTDALDGSTPRSPPGPPPAPPFIPGEVIGVALAVWSRHALAFTAVALVVQVPALALELRRGPGGDAASAWGLLFFGSFVGLVSEGAITLGVLQALRGERPRVGAMLAVGAKRLWLLFTVSFTYGISVLGGLFLLVVPGLLALAAGYLAIPAAVAEPGLGMEGALRRSWARTSLR